METLELLGRSRIYLLQRPRCAKIKQEMHRKEGRIANVKTKLCEYMVSILRVCEDMCMLIPQGQESRG